MKPSTRSEGSRHHAGGKRATIVVPPMTRADAEEFLYIEKIRREEGDEFADEFIRRLNLERQKQAPEQEKPNV